MPSVFFYPKQQVATIPADGVSQLLRNSLSKTLSSYYPWAGSVRDYNACTIESNDSGAEFLEVQANCPMDQVVNHPDAGVKDLTLFSQSAPWINAPALTIVQLTHFDCGGIAISAGLSHKVGDGYSAYYFLRDWAALTRDPKGDEDVTSRPFFLENSLVPSPFDGPLAFPVTTKSKKDEFASKIFVVSAAKLRALKALVAAESHVQKPWSNSDTRQPE